MTNYEHFKQCMAQLTKREKEVAGLMYSGMTNCEIGHTLKISKRTVELHRAQIMSKLQCKNPVSFGVSMALYCACERALKNAAGDVRSLELSIWP